MNNLEIMTWFRRQFTKWYVKRGYTFTYDLSNFDCPLWVKPLLIFFSPSIYCVETSGQLITETFQRYLEEGASCDYQYLIVPYGGGAICEVDLDNGFIDIKK